MLQETTTVLGLSIYQNIMRDNHISHVYKIIFSVILAIKRLSYLCSLSVVNKCLLSTTCLHISYGLCVFVGELGI